MRMAKPKPKKRAGRKATTRRPTNLTVRVDLVERARALKLNLSNVFESALAAAIREREQQAWLAENEQAIDSYNRWAEQHGLFSDDYRQF